MGRTHLCVDCGKEIKYSRNTKYKNKMCFICKKWVCLNCIQMNLCKTHFLMVPNAKRKKVKFIFNFFIWVAFPIFLTLILGGFIWFSVSDTYLNIFSEKIWPFGLFTILSLLLPLLLTFIIGNTWIKSILKPYKTMTPIEIPKDSVNPNLENEARVKVYCKNCYKYGYEDDLKCPYCGYPFAF